MLLKNFIDAFQAGKELASATTWKNSQLRMSKLAILFGALLPIAKFFGYLENVTLDDAITVASAVAIVAGVCNGTATVVSTSRIGLRGVPKGGTDAGGGGVAPVEPEPVESQPADPDVFGTGNRG